ncbi:hypothetical protein LSTR_LSTR004432 [Laodelphax striatellus]|uniref:legumain n=1 Tax=Laodelphax striatellus TaxID=195883 RepID=A0A482X9U1_LAOST|nr:hypothetical protein LSTR_LSTR004432 [Laodelphax striatellus]
MRAFMIVCLLATVVYGLPEGVANNDGEKEIDETAILGSSDVVVDSSLQNVIIDRRADFVSGKLYTKHKGKKKPMKKEQKGDGKVWVFLVAGSDGWSNYRHQADICHAYQTLVLRGIPKENIIVMMKDDIAMHASNPYKGKIMNEPNGTDVYEGVIIDYRGEDVTPENFIKVLEGDKKAMEGIGSGRVIESTENDKIFVNYDDHGSYGYVVFPNRAKLSAQNLTEAVHRMIAKKKFNKMILYLEACESGSMADSLYSSNSSVLVVTASGRFESSWACYCNEETMPCLGDAFSVRWMGDLYQEFITTNKTIFEQFDYVRSSTYRSHVNIYGDYNLANMRIHEFFGKNFKARSNPLQRKPAKPLDDELVDARDASLHWLKKMSKTYAKSANKFSKMVETIENGRELIDNVFFDIVVAVTTSEKEFKNVIDGRHSINLKIFDCYENLVNTFSDRCVDIYKNAYTLRHLRKLYNLCLLEKTPSRQILPEYMKAIESVCDDRTLALSEID